jgi:hypothetical protein
MSPSADNCFDLEEGSPMDFWFADISLRGFSDLDCMWNSVNPTRELEAFAGADFWFFVKPSSVLWTGVSWSLTRGVCF